MCSHALRHPESTGAAAAAAVWGCPRLPLQTTASTTTSYSLVACCCTAFCWLLSRPRPGNSAGHSGQVAHTCAFLLGRMILLSGMLFVGLSFPCA